MENQQYSFYYSPKYAYEDVKYLYVYSGGKKPWELSGHFAQKAGEFDQKLSKFDKIFQTVGFSTKKYPSYVEEERQIIENMVIEANKSLFDNVNPHVSMLNDLYGVISRINEHKLSPNLNRRVCYDMFSSATGRLADREFPIMSLPKEKRSIIKPNNDCLLELDFNGIDPRVALFLSGHKQPKDDIYSHIVSKLPGTKTDRQQIKTAFFQFLYGGVQNDLLSTTFDKDKILSSYDGERLINIFGRNVKTPKETAVSYMIQSTSADVIYELMIKIDKFLKDRKSFIKFSIHDSIVIDLSLDDNDIIFNIVDIFCNTRIGYIPNINASVGDNFGEMKKI